MSRPLPVEDPAIARVRRLAHLLDDSIPIPGVGRIGLDPLIGLIPGVGDAAGALLSAYLIVEAGRIGVPRSLLVRMGTNVAVETVVGAIPFLGDLFDAGWKANSRNARLLLEYLETPRTTARASRAFVGGVLVLLLLLFAGAAAVTVLLVRWLLSLA
ncbi:MAG: DUF4112 domain-containing protein [Gemmatimonadota bacterium]|nr:DUF4112 domain-containing protein [Gemmatimonadota bacterium]